MIERLSFSHYRFSFKPQDFIQMPKYGKGNILRGAFGASLRRLICTMRSSPKPLECIECYFKENCPYTLIFSPIGLIQAKRLQNPPRGYVIKPPLETTTEYNSERPFSFEMILIGDRTSYLPYLIITFVEMGRFGIGLNRGKFNLSDIDAIRDGEAVSIYDSSSNRVKNIMGAITGPEIMRKVRNLNPREITIRFLTPTRIKYNPTGEKDRTKVVRVPEFHHLIRRLRDRLNALCITYCGGPLDLDFKGIAERAIKIKTIRVNLQWVEHKRKGYHDQSGFLGEIVFQGDLLEFLPLIIAGQYLHVGEDAVFGNGWYEIA